MNKKANLLRCKPTRQLAIALLAGLLFASTALVAMHKGGESKDADRTLSPYFFVLSDDPALDQMPLKSTAVQAGIAGVIADVTVRQIYKNEGKKALEAIYTFPASTRAAVYGMTMTIGERTIVAKIDRREQARQSYEQARQRGQSASLLEQQRPNVFQMSVANILPGDVVEVELKYTELLVPENGQYEFVYPTVVGPRYSNLPADAAPASENWVANPYLHTGEKPTSTLNLNATLQAGMPIQDIRCASHETDIAYEGKSEARITLTPAEKHGGNRDFILRYRLTGSQIESGLLLHRGDDENHFLLMVEPPERIGITAMPAREYIFIVDVSGSMNRFPLEVSKALLHELIGKLQPADRFNVLLFASSSRVLSEQSLSATEENIEKALLFIDNERGGGGTEILPALRRALALPRSGDAVSRTIVVATDGYVRVEPQVFDLIRNSLGKANLFAFGIGTSVNRHLIEGMAHAGMGEPFVMTGEAEARKQASRFIDMVQSPVLTNIKIDFGQFDTYDVEPVSVPDVLAQRPVMVFGKWRGQPRGRVTLTGRTAEGSYRKRLDVSAFTAADENSALRYLWARHKLQQLADYSNLQNGRNDELIEQITELGLKYNLLTAYTSFVAIDSEVRNAEGETTVVKQPLPMPQGVSDLAVASSYASSGIRMLKKGEGGVAPIRAIAPADGEGALLQQNMLAEEAPSKASSPIAPFMKITKIEVRGGLSALAVRRAFENSQAELQALVRQDSRAGGEIVLAIEIAADGSVTKVRIVQIVDSLRAIEKRLREFVEKMRFPAHSQSSKIKITLAFTA